MKVLENGERKSMMNLVSRGLDTGMIELNVYEHNMTAHIGEYIFFFGESDVQDDFSFDHVPRERLVNEIVIAMEDIRKAFSEEEYLHYQLLLNDGDVSVPKTDL